MNETQNKHTNFLALTILGNNTPGLLPEITRAIKECGCSISENRTNVFGKEISITMLLNGNWDAIAKIEGGIDRIKSRYDIDIISKRTGVSTVDKDMMPYAIDIVTYDHIGIVNDIVEFIVRNDLEIQEIQTNTYNASYTGTRMFSMHMIINVPIDFPIATMRGDFMDFCDRLNLDAIMEPVK